MGGRTDEAEQYLRRAIEAEPRYTNARLLLAKLFMKSGRTEGAKAQLRALLETADPHYPSVWRERFKPEAEGLLRTLERSSP